jgi:hypothetical protein
MSGDLGGHSISGWSFPDVRPIHRPGNTVFRYLTNLKVEVGGTSVLLEYERRYVCNCGISHSCNMSRYVMPVTVSSAKKNGPYTF